MLGCMNLDADYYETVIREKELLEDQLEADLYIENEIMNKDTSLAKFKRKQF